MKYYKLILFTLIATFITDILRYLSWSGSLNMNYSTYIIAFLNYLSIFIITLVIKRNYKQTELEPKVSFFFNIWIFLNIFNIVRGGFLADGYWDWKFLMLSSFSFSFISLVFYIGTNPYYTRKILHFFLKYIFTLGFLLIPLTLISNRELYSRLMIPISFFILLIPFIKLRWRVIILAVAIISILIVIDFRSNIIKILLSFLILGIYYFRKIFTKNIFRLLHITLFFLPILLLLLALLGYFNIFSEISNYENLSITNKEGESESLAADSRSFLYVEVISSMENLKEILIGKSSSGSYNSDWFFDNGGALKGVRYQSEVNILNIFLYHGLIGVILYFILLYTVSYSAITNSNNILIKMFGLLIASRWTLSFIEEFTQYDLNFFFFWLIMGLISTSILQKMTNDEIHNFFKSL